MLSRSLAHHKTQLLVTHNRSIATARNQFDVLPRQCIAQAYLGSHPALGWGDESFCWLAAWASDKLSTPFRDPRCGPSSLA